MAKLGRRTYYSPKMPNALTVNLTVEGRRLLDLVTKRTGKSRGDVFEHLLRHHYKTIWFPKEELP
jgi:hypothetical protein